jgi:hypothetical protein
MGASAARCRVTGDSCEKVEVVSRYGRFLKRSVWIVIWLVNRSSRMTSAVEALKEAYTPGNRAIKFYARLRKIDVIELACKFLLRFV